MKVAVLIVAAGRGQRVGGETPKQYLPLCGRPVLHHTIAAFRESPHVSIIQTVIHPDDRDLYDRATAAFSLLDPVCGGATRQQSVMNGLQALAAHEPEIVLIHDAARPFVSRFQLEQVIAHTGSSGAALPTLPLADTIKQVSDGRIEGTVDRDRLVRAQTPQGFRFKLIYMAHQKMAHKEDGPGSTTDDCAVAESCGIRVLALPGDENNFKITTPDDMKKAQKMLSEKYSDIRTGMGYDVHAFEAGDQVTLGGVTIPHSHRLKGHSDADVALHALTDALLGAIAEGDIGSHFPPSDMQWQDAGSDIFLRHAAGLLRERKGIIANIDLTLICEAPKITPHRDAIRHNIAGLLDLDPGRVSIKATTTEKLGFTGRAEGIAAQAVVTVRLQE